MKLIIDGSMEQLIDLLRKFNITTVTLDIAADVISLNLNKTDIQPPAKSKPACTCHHKQDEPPKCPPKENTEVPNTKPAEAEVTTEVVEEVKPQKAKRASGAAPEGAQKKCAICGNMFKPKWYRSKYCPECVSMYGNRVGIVAAKLKNTAGTYGEDEPEPSTEIKKEEATPPEVSTSDLYSKTALRDKKLEERGSIPLDPKYFVVNACKDTISMNALALLPKFALEACHVVLTDEGKAELELRHFIRTHPDHIPEDMDL